jgi:hypothetical protein
MPLGRRRRGWDILSDVGLLVVRLCFQFSLRSSPNILSTGASEQRAVAQVNHCRVAARERFQNVAVARHYPRKLQRNVAQKVYYMGNP